MGWLLYRLYPLNHDQYYFHIVTVFQLPPSCWSSRLQFIVRFSIGWQWWFATYSSTSGGATLLASLLEVAEEKIQQTSTVGSINGDRRSDLNITLQGGFFGATKEKAVAKKKNNMESRRGFFRNSRLKNLGDVLYYVHNMFIYRYVIFQFFLCQQLWSLEIHPRGDAVSTWWILGGNSFHLIDSTGACKTVCEISGASESQVGKICKIIKLVL